MLRIKDIMCKKVITAKEDVTIQAAIQLLNDRHVGSVIVVDDEERCIGVFTERDAIRVAATRFSTDQPLGKIMSRHVVTMPIEGSFDEAKRLILSHNVRHLPVTDQTGKLIGLFCLRAFFDEVFGIQTPTASAP